MRLLLDTHVFLWSVMDDRKLTKAARKLILEADEVYVSSASVWEASIKVGLGKLEADVGNVRAVAVGDFGRPSVEVHRPRFHSVGKQYT